MKVAVYPQTKSIGADNAVDGLHLVRPIRHTELGKMLRAENIKKISMSPSTYERLSRKAKAVLNEKEIVVDIEKRQGRTLSADGKNMKDIVELHRDFKSYRAIEKELGIPKSTAHYLVKYAKRSKLKRGNKVFYLD